MLERFDSQPNIDVQESEYIRLLGYPPHRELEGRGRELADLTRTWFEKNGKPWVYLRQLKELEVTDTGLVTDGVAFTSKRVREQFTEAEASIGIVVAASAGKECEEYAQQLWKEGKPDEYFFMEMYGSAIVEHLVTRAGATLCEWADPQGIAILPHYSPGYPEWDIVEQLNFLDLIKSGANGVGIGEIHSLDTGMLKPKKSLLALFGATRNLDKASDLATLIPCESCSLPGCAYRRVPYYLDTLKEMNSAETLEAEPLEESEPVFALNQEATYSIHRKALRKWTRDRLEMETASDGSTSARFLYEGTTCSNMGYPLKYVYSIKVGPADTNYEILEALCAPAEGDVGYKKQCEYLKVGEAMNQTIADEQPLVGEPLEEVFNWNHRSGSSGCYCDFSGRNHKWGLAYEVVHFAMAKREAEARDGQAAAVGAD